MLQPISTMKLKLFHFSILARKNSTKLGLLFSTRNKCCTWTQNASWVTHQHRAPDSSLGGPGCWRAVASGRRHQYSGWTDPGASRQPWASRYWPVPWSSGWSRWSRRWMRSPEETMTVSQMMLILHCYKIYYEKFWLNHTWWQVLEFVLESKYDIKLKFIQAIVLNRLPALF